MPPKFGAAKVLCPVCNQRVYPMESVNFEGQTYHKPCMKCTHCNKKVSIKGLAVINGQLYCKPHFVELFKSGGGRYENFGSSDNLTLLDDDGPKNAEKPAKPVSSQKAPEKAVALSSSIVQKKAGDAEIKPAFAGMQLKSASNDEKEAKEEGSLFDSIQAKDLDALKKTIESVGVDVIFQKGTEGMTPIEYAFKNNSDACGRHMILHLQNSFTK
mmetsp:Transcript_22740/g.56189  ORF Transcript_22740/g.56189 Transcript_22740/m.56189 type:complete len:214 (+) Transcript_22740:92-733(+)|eukprot:CAMPEP_0113605068 /NCGR_PEP_ID=MMETSP0017_2-20120614/2128_1 /TAXON_ID=2856 /ORGANISM="Cylindrotheca closterium" /LENGTH=213 /DNA_ID=CAMNT_0000513529 /DNA_START=79 /DNA_END=720 /DNA_ORIENTATION=- /assembly_acc=CAM_ASM_000147